MRDYVGSKNRGYASAHIVLSIWIGNIINIFVWDVTANDFHNVVGYSLPSCDLQLHMEYKYIANTQYDGLVKQVSLVLIVFQLYSLGIQSIR